jgi:chromosome segregation ATPase
MNQPTREEFEEFKQEIRQEVKQLREQRTEEIKAVRVEVASEDVVNRLKALEQGQKEFKQEATKRLDTVQGDTNVLKIEMQGARADILQIRESQADLRDRLIEHSEDLKDIKEKQDAHSELLGQLINIGEETKTAQAEHTKRFDKLEGIMMQILNRLPKTEGE